MHILNLYKDQRVLMFRRCYVLEKVHGTSAHVSWKDGQVTLFSGGEPMVKFATLFDKDVLKAKFEEMGCPEVTIYGEAYGGSQQGMKDTYGDQLRFIVFDVKVGESWLNVPNMAQVAERLGFEVVPWEETSTDLSELDHLRDEPSEVAVRRGCGVKPREGVVIRPLEEMTTNNGARVIAKHKGAAFEERKTPPKVIDGDKVKVLAAAREIAEEWVTEERLTHVIDHLTVDGVAPSIESTGKVIAAMVEDVYREAKDEIVESKEAKAAISRRAAELFKARLKSNLKEVSS